jgi:hypothetical protein
MVLQDVWFMVSLNGSIQLDIPLPWLSLLPATNGASSPVLCHFRTKFCNKIGKLIFHVLLLRGWMWRVLARSDCKVPSWPWIFLHRTFPFFIMSTVSLFQNILLQGRTMNRFLFLLSKDLLKILANRYSLLNVHSLIFRSKNAQIVRL